MFFELSPNAGGVKDYGGTHICIMRMVRDVHVQFMPNLQVVCYIQTCSEHFDVMALNLLENNSYLFCVWSIMLRWRC